MLDFSLWGDDIPLDHSLSWRDQVNPGDLVKWGTAGFFLVSSHLEDGGIALDYYHNDGTVSHVGDSIGPLKKIDQFSTYIRRAIPANSLGKLYA